MPKDASWRAPNSSAHDPIPPSSTPCAPRWKAPKTAKRQTERLQQARTSRNDKGPVIPGLFDGLVQRFLPSPAARSSVAVVHLQPQLARVRQRIAAEVGQLEQ